MAEETAMEEAVATKIKQVPEEMARPIIREAHVAAAHVAHAGVRHNILITQSPVLGRAFLCDGVFDAQLLTLGYLDTRF